MQILHAVYVSGNLVRLYEPLESGGKGKKDVLASTNPPLLRTPAAVKAARRHFGCGEMEEIELEDVPGAEDLVTSHWSTRLLAGELMTSHAGPHPSVLSALTAALAEDTGWYKHSGTTSVGILKHGLDAGCNFLEEAEKCNRPASVASSATFCPESSKNHRCTRDGRGHSPCKALEGIPGCYVVDEIDAFHDCGDPTSATSTRETMFGVYHGYKGRCMEVTKPITVSLGLREETLDAGAKCFKFECKNDELFLVLGFVNIRCPSGDFIDVSALDIDAGFRSGKLGPCPDNKAICNSMNCPMDCSSNGVCDPTSASGTCGCSLGHGFNRFADAREDCSAPLMCRNDTSCAPLKCDKVTGSCGFAVQSLSSTVHKTISELGFTKSITDLFDAVDIFATAYVNNQKLTHIAAMVMSLIDTDQDGTPDDGKLLKELRKQKPAVFIYADEADKERTKQRQEGLSRKDYNLFVSYRKQELFAEEIVTQPEEDDPLDAGMLGVLVLLFNYGWSQAYDELNKPLERAMDQAAGKCGYLYCGDDSQCGKWRGPDCDGIYHDGQDSDCDRDCLLPEYFALAVSASYGALDRRGACSAVSHVWSACSPEDVESKNSEFFETIAKYTSSDGDMPQRLSAREGGRIINAPLLPLGSAYRQYDAATYQVSLPLDTGFDELMIKGASREGETNVLKKQARAGSDTSDDGSSADTSNAESSSEKGSEKATADATDADNSFYGGSSNGGNTDLPGSDSFYSIYGYLSAGGQRVGSIVNNRMVLVGGGEAGAVKPGSLDDRQTWEQLVLGLIASMESRKEDGNEGSTRTLEIKCQRDRFDQCCDAPNLLDAAQVQPIARVSHCSPAFRVHDQAISRIWHRVI